MSNSDADTITTTQNASEASLAGSTKAEAILSGTYTDTTLSGNATFEEMDGKVKMILNITAPAKASLPPYFRSFMPIPFLKSATLVLKSVALVAFWRSQTATLSMSLADWASAFC